MEKISIRDLHFKTGEWVRKAAAGEGVVITDRGRPVATLLAMFLKIALENDLLRHRLPAEVLRQGAGMGGGP
jgi:prevent-host-death family protein